MKYVRLSINTIFIIMKLFRQIFIAESLPVFRLFACIYLSLNHYH